MKKQYIRIWKDYDERDKKWIIRVSGITSGFVVDGGDGDNISITFKFDASRFEPVIAGK